MNFPSSPRIKDSVAPICRPVGDFLIPFPVEATPSGVTILALGGLMFPMLLHAGYKERFTLGLLTTSGSLGLLFAPSLPLILYAVIAQQLGIGGPISVDVWPAAVQAARGGRCCSLAVCRLAIDGVSGLLDVRSFTSPWLTKTLPYSTSTTSP